MVRLRELIPEDAAGMYEWLHDDNVISWFRFNGRAMTMEDVELFIASSGESGAMSIAP